MHMKCTQYYCFNCEKRFTTTVNLKNIITYSEMLLKNLLKNVNADRNGIKTINYRNKMYLWSRICKEFLKVINNLNSIITIILWMKNGLSRILLMARWKNYDRIILASQWTVGRKYKAWLNIVYCLSTSSK